MQFANTTAFT